MRISDWSSDVCSSDLCLHLALIDNRTGHADHEFTRTGIQIRGGEYSFTRLGSLLIPRPARGVPPVRQLLRRRESMSFIGPGHIRNLKTASMLCLPQSLRSEESRVGKEGVHTGR